jgi:hypothetical protein
MCSFILLPLSHSNVYESWQWVRAEEAEIWDESLQCYVRGGPWSWLFQSSAHFIQILFLQRSAPWSTLHKHVMFCSVMPSASSYLAPTRLGRPPLCSSGQSSWLQSQTSGFDSRRYQIFWEVVGLERGPFSLVRTTEELPGRKVAAPV